jgi:glycosyltransferase involved in cell wall biosynthesis
LKSDELSGAARATGPRPRVVILVENLPVPFDRRVWQEATALHAAGWRVAVIGPRGSGEMRRLVDRIDGISVFRYPQRAATGLSAYLVEYLPSILFTVAWYLLLRLRGRIHVVHGCNPPDLFWLIGRLNVLMGGAYIFDQHDAVPELAATKWGAAGLKGGVLRGVTEWLERRSYGAASLVIAPNDSYAQVAVTRGGRDPRSIIVVRNAPDVRAYRGLATGIEAESHRVGYVGVMGSHDGLEALLDAWRLVRNEPDMGDAVLDLVGDGIARAQLVRRTRTLGLEGSVIFHGYRLPAEWIPVLARATVCVSPDPPTAFNHISTMTKVVDYLAMGKGIVTFDLDESRRLAGSGAVVARPATAVALAGTLLELMRNPRDAARLAAASAVRVDELGLDWFRSADVLVRGYAVVLDGLSGDGRAPAPPAVRSR